MNIILGMVLIILQFISVYIYYNKGFKDGYRAGFNNFMTLYREGQPLDYIYPEDKV